MATRVAQDRAVEAARRTSGIAVALWVLAVIAALFFLRAAAQLLIPIIIGVLISYALEPIVAWLERHRVPRLAGASLVVAVTAGLAAWGLYSTRGQVVATIDMLPEAARQARELIMQSGEGTVENLQQAAKELDGGSGGSANQGMGAVAGPALVQGVGSVFALAGHLVVIVFLVAFLLTSGQHVRNRLIEIAGPGRRRLIAEIVDQINTQIQRFLLVRLVTAVVVGVLTWAVLAWMDVRGAAVWGALAGAFNSIPYFGPVIVSGGLLVVGLVQSGNMSQALQMSGAALLITSIEGWVLTPPLMGRAERMSALAVFLGILLWTWVWGAWGTILAVPMLVVVKAVADNVPPLKPIGRLLAP